MIAGHSLGGTIAGYIGSEGDQVTTLNKTATIGQCLRKNEKACRVSGGVVSALHKNKRLQHYLIPKIQFIILEAGYHIQHL